MSYATKTTVPDADGGRLVGPGGHVRRARDLQGPRARTARLAEPHFLVIGPWNHGQWRGRRRRPWGRSTSDAPPARLPRRTSRRRSSSSGLKDTGARRSARRRVFDAGANAWSTYASWPPKEATHAVACTSTPTDACASPRPPTRRGFDQLRVGSGASGSVPARARSSPPMTRAGPRWHTWQVEDQRFVDDRPDVSIVGNGAAHRGSGRRGRRHGRLFAVDDGQRRRLGRQADRRLPRRLPAAPRWAATN